eukprot:m.34890 g.34890  ORF g.34890 m.34890 type:complete len:81 (-) comp9828_c0_seq1:36-278(-)
MCGFRRSLEKVEQDGKIAPSRALSNLRLTKAVDFLSALLLGQSRNRIMMMEPNLGACDKKIGVTLPFVLVLWVDQWRLCS